MNSDQQIDEMANTYYEAMLKARETLGSMNEGAPKWYAKELYAKGYRKADEVAREIFSDIELKAPFFCENQIAYEHFYEELAELKKKYTEGKDV